MGGVIEGMGKWQRTKAVLGSPYHLTKKDGKAGGLAGFYSEKQCVCSCEGSECSR